MAEPQPDASPVEPTDSEILQLFADEGIVTYAALQGRMLAAFARPLIQDEWRPSMVMRACELWIDSGYLNTEEDE